MVKRVINETGECFFHQSLIFTMRFQNRDFLVNANVIFDYDSQKLL